MGSLRANVARAERNGLIGILDASLTKRRVQDGLDLPRER